MKNFVDREKATKNINALLTEHTTPWLVLSGSSKIGKTEFARKIASMNDHSVFCAPGFETMYACALVQSVLFLNNMDLKNAIYEFTKKDRLAHSLFESLGQKYAVPLQNSQLKSVIKLLIKNDISSGLYSFAHYLGTVIDPQVKCIFLDEFHRCDFDSYCWILELWGTLHEPQPTVVVICNFDLEWESCKVQNIFRGIPTPISIDTFDSETAFYDIIKEHFVFKNDSILSEISKKLFTLFDGSSRMLFETLELLEGKTVLLDDEEKMTQIISMAHQVHLRSFDGVTKSHLLVMHLLAYVPNPISRGCIRHILDLSDQMAVDIIARLFNDNFIKQIADRATGKTLYCLRDSFLAELIKSGCSLNEQLFYKTKIYRAIQSGHICASLEQVVNLAIELSADEAEELVLQYIEKPEREIPPEKKASVIDKLLHNIPNTSSQLISTDIARLLYDYGYYQAAQKVISCWISSTNILTYDDLLLLGDIQHILLSPEASHTYMQAAKIEGISPSDKLKALNRQIMALNQEHQETLAASLYIEAFAQYESVPCSGLVELYRNSNNSFGFDAAMEYTTKGYFLAKKLGDELEMNKCLHNICMLLLQYGRYGKPIEKNPLDIEPSFEQVLHFLKGHPEYRHEQAYPLLDLGTVKMFEFADTDNKDCLTVAKKYYSQAQLYAKSFYACHIAETGLLVVNSYLYADWQSSFILESREKLYKRYTQQKASIADYRAHRKILLSLALSAIITEEMQEAANYLGQAAPYVSGAETYRFNKLCKKAGCIEYIKAPVSLDGKYEVYYASDKLVPWLISLCH